MKETELSEGAVTASDADGNTTELSEVVAQVIDRHQGSVTASDADGNTAALIALLQEQMRSERESRQKTEERLLEIEREREKTRRAESQIDCARDGCCCLGAVVACLGAVLGVLVGENVNGQQMRGLVSLLSNQRLRTYSDMLESFSHCRHKTLWLRDRNISPFRWIGFTRPSRWMHEQKAVTNSAVYRGVCGLVVVLHDEYFNSRPVLDVLSLFRRSLSKFVTCDASVGPAKPASVRWAATAVTTCVGRIPPCRNAPLNGSARFSQVTDLDVPLLYHLLYMLPNLLHKNKKAIHVHLQHHFPNREYCAKA